MADTVRTIGTGGDYADPILWAAAEGNVSDGTRAVGELISDVTMSALFRPNQSFPNGGLLRGDTTVTGKTGDGRSLGNTAGTRICLAPSANIDFHDIEFIKGANTYSIQSLTGSNLTRIISKDLTITPVSPYTSVFNNVILGGYDLNTSGAATAQMNNVLAAERLIVRTGETLNFKNSASLATDWLLGRGTYTESETLVNYCHLLQDAPASDFGAGSSNNTYPSDITLEMVDYAGGDYRIKATSPLATAGEGGTFIGAFLESGGGGNDVILDIDNGSFALSGSDVLLSAKRIEQALNGNYSLSGSNVNFSIGYAINLDSGIYSLSGSATGLVLNANTVIESGAYSLTGSQVNLAAARKTIIDSGSYNLTGTDVTLVYTPGGGGELLSITSGSFSLSGSDIGLKATRLISVNSGSYDLTGQPISLTYNAKTIIDSGSYALSGSNVNLFANRVIIAQNGNYALTGSAVVLRYSGEVTQTIGTVTSSFAEDAFSVNYKPNTITVNFKE